MPDDLATPRKKKSLPGDLVLNPEALEDALIGAGLSMREVARRCQARGTWMDHGMISLYARGTKQPSTGALNALAAVLGVKPKDLLVRQPEKAGAAA